MDKDQVTDSDRGALTEGASRQLPKNIGHSRRAFFTRTAIGGLGACALSAPPYKAANAALSTATAKSAEETDLRQPVVNVCDFGAKGDGVTDDTTKIQKAIDSLAGRTGTVFFPAGIYLISNTPSGWCLLLRSNIDYVGEGPVSKLLLAPTVEIYVQMMRAEASRQITIRRLHFDGNRASQPANQQHYAVYLGAVEDCRVEGCLFHDMAGDGIFVNGGQVQGKGKSERVVVEDNELYGYFFYGIHLTATNNSIVCGNLVHDTSGFALLNDNSGGVGNKFIGNRVCRALGFNIGAGARNGLIADNTFIMTTRTLEMVEVSASEISRNNFWQTYGSAIVVGSSQDITIKDNSVREGLFTERFNSAISVDLTGSDASSDGIKVYGNEISNNAMTGCYLRQCTNAFVKDNLIFNNQLVDKSAIGIRLQGSSHTVVSGNTIKRNDVGIYIEGLAGDNHFLENNVLANTSGGISIVLGAGSHNDFHSNRIQGNTPFGLSNQSTAQVDARGNFWGCAAGPNNPGCDTVKGSNVLF
jgi:parallel beta-helix repeat protein